MNVRKLTVEQAAARAGLPPKDLRVLLTERSHAVSEPQAAALASMLSVEVAQLAAAAADELGVVHQSAEELRSTRRAIQRNGSHFYNYYTMAAPIGRVAPVVLDILCPADRLPALNNGHLEPAITVNLGPGDVNGRWGAELSPQTWKVLAANKGEDRWITGDSYVEPSHCPHTYSLAGPTPARIVSYTAQSDLASLVGEMNTWATSAFEEAALTLAKGLTAAALLDNFLARRMHSRSSAAAAAGITEDEIDRAVRHPLREECLHVLRGLGGALGFDYRVLLPAMERRDPVGKTWATVADARASQRRTGCYTASSMASAPHLPDLVGTFLRIDSGNGSTELTDVGETHYLVIEGDLTLRWEGPDAPADVRLTPDGSAWIAPFTRHHWLGSGAVLRFGSGAHIGYRDWLELTNTFEAATTLRRSRRDLSGWGYDN